jgi:AcrR family transcriptional regulator
MQMAAPSQDRQAADRPLRADARRNCEHIVATAREAFSELGPDAPLDVIARRAGVGSATLYRHFPTREVLIAAVYRPDIADLASSALDLAQRHAPREALERWIGEYFVPAQEQGGLAVMLKDAVVRAPEVFSRDKQQLNDAVQRLVAAAQQAGEVRKDIEANDILRMAHGIAMASPDAPRARERMLAIMFDGLRPAS